MVIKSIPTKYNGTKFRSKLEATWAEWLDQYNIKHSYEIEGYDLEDGTWYLPDFYLPEVDTFIEVKGAMENIDKPYKMIQLLKRDYPEWPSKGPLFLLAGPVNTLYNIEQSYYMGFKLVKCGKCSVTSIVTEYGSYACRACSEHNGNHDIIGSIPVITKPLRWLFLERD